MNPLAAASLAKDFAPLIKSMLKVIVVILVIAVVLYAVYRVVKLADADAKFPNNGGGIPAGWTPNADAATLYNAMHSSGAFGWGTDEESIWIALEGKTPDQLAAIYNQYKSKYGNNLFKDFDDELSGDDHRRAMGYFNGIQIG